MSANNLLKIGSSSDKSYHIHPSYLSFKHVNPVMYGLEKELSPQEVEAIKNGFRRSTFTEEALITDYLRGEVPKHDVIKDEHYRKALEVTTNLFKPKEQYRPVSFPDLRYYPWTLPTSAESPYTFDPYWKEYVKEKYEQGLIQDERITFHNLYNEIFTHNREKVHRIKDGIYVDRHGNDLKYHNQAHARSHLVESTEEDKIRMVFGVPKLLLQVETMFLWPLINDLVNRDSPMLWGFETLKGGWYKMYRWMSEHPIPSTYLAFDWKQFDKRAQFTIIDDIHDIIKSYIDFEHGYIPTHEYPESWTEPERLHRLFDWMRIAIKHTPDLLPNGDMYVRQHAGIASGFFQTQLLDSMYNTIILLTILSSLGFNIYTLKIKVQGDDSIIGLLEPIAEPLHTSFMDLFAKESERRFGAILNVKKSKMSCTLNGLPLLGFTNHHGLPTRSRDELLASLLYPERKSDESRLMARCIGIAYANCGYHPQIYRVCNDIFCYLEEKGFSPNSAGLPDLIRFMETVNFGELNIDLTKFPSFYETFNRLTQIPERSKSQKEKFWPTTQFLSTY